MRRTTPGFTLIELLIVIAVIALLVSLAMPVVNQALHSAAKASCVNQLRQVAAAFGSYQHQYGLWSHKAPNNGYWEYPLGTVLPPSSPTAYWGVAYGPFLDGDRPVFRCPAALAMYSSPGYADWEEQPETSYGLSCYVSNKLVPTVFRKSSETILCHDAFEHLLDGNGDMLCIRSGDSINLTQWRSYAGGLFEYFRHNNQCNIAWLDCHVSSVTLCGEYPMEAYTGK